MATCRSCNYQIKPFFSLGDIPLVNSFLTKDQIKKEKKYELTVSFCENCYLVQLTKTIPPKDLFTEYIYLSGTSKIFIKHSKELADHLEKKLKLTKNNFVLEIASNDGTQLQFYKQKGMAILGVDPAKNIARIANKNGIKTIPKFFNHIFAKKYIKAKKRKPNLIFGANVLAHVPNIIDFAKGVKTILDENGSAVFEFPYLQGLLENKFDIIYHEHVFYYSLIALKNLFSKADLIVYDVEQTPMQGGSLLLFVGHPDKHTITDRAKKLLEEELQSEFHKVKTYTKMEQNVSSIKQELLQKIVDIKKQGKTIAAYSAPAKGLVLLNYFGIGKECIEFIVDKAKEKQGLFAPGVHMEVFPIEKILKEQPDYVLILCWNIADEVIELLDGYRKKGGHFIIPIPKVKMV